MAMIWSESDPEDDKYHETAFSSSERICVKLKVHITQMVTETNERNVTSWRNASIGTESNARIL
jgi:hypothetical protein